jgi:hypothetical protein
VTAGNRGPVNRGGTDARATADVLNPVQPGSAVLSDLVVSWSRQELAATTEAFFPAELPELLRLADDAS